MPFHPDLARAARWLPRGVASAWTVPLLRWLPAPPARLPDGVGVEARRVDAHAAVRVIGAPGARPAVLWIHGGGYVIGAARQDDGVCGRLAAALGVAVVSVDYRLAPEHPYPAPLDDCFAACTQAFGEAPYVIAGQSAGAGLAAALAQRLHDAGAPPPRLQVLIYPMLDDRTVLRDVDAADHRLWNPSSNAYGWRAYLGRAPGGPDVPAYAAPARRDDLTGLAPAWIGVGTHDLFHDEDVAYAARLRDAGVPVQLEIVDGAFHGFDAALPDAPVSRRFFGAQVAAIRAALADAG